MGSDAYGGGVRVRGVGYFYLRQKMGSEIMPRSWGLMVCYRVRAAVWGLIFFLFNKDGP